MNREGSVRRVVVERLLVGWAILVLATDVLLFGPKAWWNWLDRWEVAAPLLSLKPAVSRSFGGRHN
jgi:hypothetical protein